MSAEEGGGGNESWMSAWPKVESEISKILAKDVGTKIAKGEVAAETVEDLIKWYPEVFR